MNAYLTRRTLTAWIGFAVATPAITAELRDPIHELIERHRTAWDRTKAMLSTDPEWDEALDRENELWGKLIRTQPTTRRGLDAFMQHVAQYPDLDQNGLGAGIAVRTIAETTKALAA